MTSRKKLVDCLNQKTIKQAAKFNTDVMHLIDNYYEKNTINEMAAIFGMVGCAADVLFALIFYTKTKDFAADNIDSIINEFSGLVKMRVLDLLKEKND